MAMDEGPTGAIAEVVAELSSENRELRATIDRLTARTGALDHGHYEQCRGSTTSGPEHQLLVLEVDLNISMVECDGT